LSWSHKDKHYSPITLGDIVAHCARRIVAPSFSMAIFVVELQPHGVENSEGAGEA
jgi:hypothetical protein